MKDPIQGELRITLEGPIGPLSRLCWATIEARSEHKTIEHRGTRDEVEALARAYVAPMLGRYSLLRVVDEDGRELAREELARGGRA